ncbi:HAD family phosphatase [Gemella sp. GH3]|uniref:HAD family hydrolase n=1 Tax=unclassified Gemella TaxID=2624949 RepID=UPI0015CFCDCD|nr:MULTISPECIES: HAD family hydrolase [unclassified Gemella]MBF0713431.1 HAD family phosphatase [Gemella sp. GH3.1]NYS50383.1 HAD family phosphatase [Gemella sp. GH3]
MSKWFVTDMDGTFLNDNREISPRSKDVMNKLQSNNIKFFIATGRVDLAIRSYYNLMGLDDAVISCNGSFIRNLKTGEIIYEKYFSEEEITYIYEKYMELTDGSIEFHIYSANYIYSDTLSFSLARIRRVEENLPDNIKTPMHITKDILGDIKKNNDRIYKVMISSKNHDLLRKIASEVNKKFRIESTFSATNFFDIMPAGCGKGEGIKRVAEYYGMDIKDSVVFGDNFNDIDMLKVAGTSICPSNAKEEIKKMCDEIIGNNNDFSVLNYIENYINSLEN